MAQSLTTISGTGGAGISSNISIGDFNNLGSSSIGYVHSNGISAVDGIYNYPLTTYLNTPSPKNGDIKIDGATLKAMIYDSEFGWVDCEIKTIETEDGQTILEVTHNISVEQSKKNTQKREVLFEKTKKPQTIIFGSAGTTVNTINLNNIWLTPSRPQITYDSINTDLFGTNLNPVTSISPIAGETSIKINAINNTVNMPSLTFTLNDNDDNNVPVGTIWNDGANLVVKTNSGNKKLINLD
jgi:hypothetical protein